MKSVVEIIKDYVAAAEEHGAATDSANSDKANSAAKQISRDWDALRASKGNWIVEFLKLLVHESKWVRLWAASHALNVSPGRAAPVLEQLAAERGLHAFDAKMALRTWEAGKLNPTN